ncbi:MAG TPA: adenylate/guanylate cyclase domain-containing protein, partial [Ignavibacteriaceae bacterium]|nr:adenylate/guanylate cyclase domain-containing protein [Ignavibacteriaceae bacterium]
EFKRVDDDYLVSSNKYNSFKEESNNVRQNSFEQRINRVGSSQDARSGPGSNEKAYKHKLLTVMFTDIKDYSKKMNLDERSAIEMLEMHNRMLDSAIKNFNGIVIETIGDSFLASFESAAAAAECAVKIQRSFADYNTGKSPDEKIELRISLHLGDVVQFGEGLKGDVINVAARIQELTSAGDIYISQSVYNTIKSKTHFLFQELGTYSIKNIREPVTLYKILP